HLQTGELRARIARYLLFLADTPASYRDEKGLYVTLSHEEIADATASTRESVSKILSDLRQEGLISTAYRKVYLLDLQALEAQAEGALEAA
ncbi:helix-turn-helix domain-containing protein, partial [Shewanella sp. C31]|nr:helix-turn-helix domain-containing protein [Shewanella electrica]